MQSDLEDIGSSFRQRSISSYWAFACSWAFFLAFRHFLEVKRCIWRVVVLDILYKLWEALYRHGQCSRRQVVTMWWHNTKFYRLVLNLKHSLGHGHQQHDVEIMSTDDLNFKGLRVGKVGKVGFSYSFSFTGILRIRPPDSSLTSLTMHP